jgi:basic amino acid/polyamine antiporter, APA family
MVTRCTAQEVRQPIESACGSLTALDGAAVVVSTVVGAGIFTVPAIVASLTGSSSGFIAVWVLGGLLALAGAFTYAELASRLPEAGGEYVYLREAFGALPGFLSGWTSFVAGFSGAIAASAAGFALYLARLVPSVGSEPWWALHAGPLTITLSPATLTALAVIAVFTAIAVVGTDAARKATNVLAVVLVVTIVVCVAAGLLMPEAATLAPLVASPSTSASLSGMAAALVPVMFTYSGWNAAAYISNEFRDPRRSVPRALVGGTIVVILLYVGLNVAFLRSVGITKVAGSAAPADAAARIIFGQAGGSLMTVIVLLALASSVCAMVITGPRIYLQMARDHSMPAVFGRVQGGGIPTASIALQSVWSAALVVTGTFDALITYTGVAIVLFGAAAVATVFVFRRRNLGTPRFRLPGYPVVPLLFIVASAWMLVATARREPMALLAGVAVMLAGVPLYFVQRRGVSRVERQRALRPGDSPT